MEERLRKVGQELDELRAKVAAAAERTEKELKQQLAEAEQKQKAASRQLEKPRKESAERWKKLATEMNDAAADLEKACERARSRFKE
jgi:flagellar hook-basal body complex protein FliE